MSVVGEIARTLRPAPGDRHGPLVPIMIVLTFVTGVVDAASYLRLGHVFVLALHASVAAALAVAGALVCAAGVAVHVLSRRDGDANWIRP